MKQFFHNWILLRFACLASLPAAMLSLPVCADDDFSIPVQVNRSGTLEVGKTIFAINHWGDQWRRTPQNEKNVLPQSGFPHRRPGEWALEGTFRTRAGDWKIRETVTGSSNAVSYQAELTPVEKMTTVELALSSVFPLKRLAGRPISIDGRAYAFGKKWDPKKWLYSISDAQTLEVPVAGGTLVFRGAFDVHLQDNRKFNLESSELRIRFRNGKNGAKVLALTLSFRPCEYVTLKLADAANMGFADEVAGDRTGGWTDQGPDNDLAPFPVGRRTFAEIAFDVVDPAANRGKSCIVLRGRERKYFPEKAEVALEHHVAAKYLYLLNAIAWEPTGGTEIGEVMVEFTDNDFVASSVDTFILKSGIDTANFWNPRKLKNAVIGWKHENSSSTIGLYVTRIELTGRPVKRITFSSRGNAVWMIAGATLSDARIEGREELPVVMRANADWFPVRNLRGIRSGSILDFSDLLDAPAGKYGFARNADEGRIVFEKRPGESVRFYGANIAFQTNFMEKRDVDTMVREMAATGYNMVRLHHFDRDLVLRKSNSTDLNPEKMERMDYLLSAFKKAGIYVTLDLQIIRHLQKGEIPDFPNTVLASDMVKGLIFVNDQVMDNYLTFCSNFLNHRNPYTGLAWKDDPAIVSISLINEDTIFAIASKNPVVRRIYEQRFQTWLTERKLAPAPGDRERLRRKFLTEVYRKGYTRIRAHLTKLGVRSLITDQNYWNNIATTLMRDSYDLVDNHFYWGHPGFLGKGWQLPAVVANDSSTARGAGGVNTLFATRIFGKPFSVTEWDFVNPNEFNVEGAFLTGAYAALQDWSILCRFTYTHKPRRIQQDDFLIEFFDCADDPLRLMSERAGALAFLRRDVSPARKACPFLMSDRYLDFPGMTDEYPASLARLGLICRTGTLLHRGGAVAHWPQGTAGAISMKCNLPKSAAPVPVIISAGPAETLEKVCAAGILAPSLHDPVSGRFTSDTGELELCRNDGTFCSMTPRSESFVLPAGKRLKGKFAEVEGLGAFSTVLVATRDGKPLADSRRILILHLTDTKNTGMRFRNDDRNIVESWGKLPLLVRRGQANVRIRAAQQGWKLYALALDGTRMEEVPLKQTDGATVEFRLDNRRKSLCIAYELIAE